MSESKRIRVSELDFDAIKTNLKNFLHGEEPFTDYNFDGSGFSVLLNLLAYNTHYNGIYTNLAVNEAFLDSASKRSSVVSRAKALGYTPWSANAAAATVSLTVANPTSFPSALTLPKHTPFTTNIDNNIYTFYTVEDVTIPFNGTNYVFPSVKIIEGTPLSFKYTAAAGMKYTIPNVGVDTNTLKVTVQDSASISNFTTYTLNKSLVSMDATTTAYYTKEVESGLYEIYFGDDIVSKGLQNGNIVNIEYFVTHGTAANGAFAFAYAGNSLVGGTIVLSTISPAGGGTSAETIDSVKFNAPRNYASQDRAVTSADYDAIIASNFSYVNSVSTWGGEENQPPVYGKTFVCVKPYDESVLTKLQKQEIVSFLGKKKVGAVGVEIVNPEYINIGIDVSVYYDENKTTKSASDITSEAFNTIVAYNTTELQRFKSVFRFSQLSRNIDMCDAAILNNITRITLYRDITPKFNTSAQYSIDLVNPIYSAGAPEDSVSSTGFYIQGNANVCALKDDGLGNIYLYEKSSGVVLNPTIGSVVYSTGTITISGLNIVALDGSVLTLTIKPASYDVTSAFTQIAQIAPELINVTAIADKTVSGDYRAGTNYTFTPSR